MLGPQMLQVLPDFLPLERLGKGRHHQQERRQAKSHQKLVLQVLRQQVQRPRERQRPDRRQRVKNHWKLGLQKQLERRQPVHLEQLGQSLEQLESQQRVHLEELE